MSFLRSYLITNLILKIFGSILSLLKIFFVRVIILLLYSYHVFVNQVLFFSMLDNTYVLIAGEWIRYLILGIWILTEITNQLRIRIATNYKPMRSKFYKWLFGIAILTFLITNFMLPKDFIAEQDPNTIELLKSSWLLVFLVILILFLVQYVIWTVSVWKSAVSPRLKIED